MRFVDSPLIMYFPWPSCLADGLKVCIASFRMDRSSRASACSLTGILASISLKAFRLFFSVETNPGGNGSFPFLGPSSRWKILRISSFDNNMRWCRDFFRFPFASGPCSVSGSGSGSLALAPFRCPSFESNWARPISLAFWIPVFETRVTTRFTRAGFFNSDWVCSVGWGSLDWDCSSKAGRKELLPSGPSSGSACAVRIQSLSFFSFLLRWSSASLRFSNSICCSMEGDCRLWNCFWYSLNLGPSDYHPHEEVPLTLTQKHDLRLAQTADRWCWGR